MRDYNLMIPYSSKQFPIEDSDTSLDWRGQFDEEAYPFPIWGNIQPKEPLKRRTRSLLKNLYPRMMGIFIPLAILLSMGVIFQHLGLIIGSLLLLFEGLYTLKVVAKREKRRKK